MVTAWSTAPIQQARPGSRWEELVFAGTPGSVAFTDIPPGEAGDLPTKRADVELIVDSAHRLLLRWALNLAASAPRTT
jgi:hypothetical protein